uniref:Thrombospondin-like N-terminal domain-containing protein n=1 Tax=Seriola dumerili TaxID=41447 RepID=A0A3B4VIH1_SERDU
MCQLSEKSCVVCRTCSLSPGCFILGFPFFFFSPAHQEVTKSLRQPSYPLRFRYAAKSGIILTPRARIQVPVRTVIPANYSSTNLSLILSLSVHRVNSAFLFSVLSKKRKVQLAVQFVPGKVLVHVGQRSSVSFDYDVHDGRWHSLALDVQGHQVFLHTSCGKKSIHTDLRSKKVEALDPEGSFLLGKMNHNSVPFEGAICQFDIYPSAKAAHNYCDYIKKHCREADTYRPVFPPLLPLFSTDPNITVTHLTPLSLTELSKKGLRPALALIEENTRTTILSLSHGHSWI